MTAVTEGGEQRKDTCRGDIINVCQYNVRLRRYNYQQNTDFVWVKQFHYVREYITVMTDLAAQQLHEQTEIWQN
jgi:hypothetical protein